eukprot:gb/GECG01003254.1/.p1 GENE.gb/GECG01003254.1/~~gb/GECG01003254.1/.p1  ORF type:complete len:441 (+),score=56.36 gb/GECG01003254.1/:1-1323(+)
MVSETRSETITFSLRKESTGFREARFLIDFTDCRSAHATLQLNKLSERSMSQIKQILNIANDKATVQKKVTSTTPNKKNLKVSVASVVVHGTQDDNASDITSPHKSQNVTTSESIEARPTRESFPGAEQQCENDTARPVRTPATKAQEDSVHTKEPNVKSAITPSTSDPQEKRSTARKQQMAPEGAIEKKSVSKAVTDVGTDVQEVATHESGKIATAPLRTRFSKPIHENSKANESVDPFDFDQTDRQSTRSVDSGRGPPKKRERSLTHGSKKISAPEQKSQKLVSNSAAKHSTIGTKSELNMLNAEMRTSKTGLQPERSKNHNQQTLQQTAQQSCDDAVQYHSTSMLKPTARALKGEFDCLNVASEYCRRPSRNQPDMRVDSDDEISALMEQVASLVSNLQKKRSGKKLTQRLNKIEDSFKTAIDSTLESLFRFVLCFR